MVSRGYTTGAVVLLALGLGGCLDADDDGGDLDGGGGQAGAGGAGGADVCTLFDCAEPGWVEADGAALCP